MANAKPFELTVTNLPEVATLKLGKKGSVEIDLTQIPAHLWGGPDGLLMRGLKRQLMNTMGAKPTTLPAEEMVQAWYLGYPHARAAGVGTEEPKSARDLKKEAAARAKLNKAAARSTSRGRWRSRRRGMQS